MIDEKKQTKAGATELTEEDMDTVQGGFNKDEQVTVGRTNTLGKKTTVVGGFKAVSGLE